MLQPGDAVVGDRDTLLGHKLAEPRHPLSVEGKEIVVEKDVPDPEVAMQEPEVLHDVFRRVEAEPTGEDRAVAVAALVGAAAAGNDAGVRCLGITEDGEVVAAGKAGEAVIGGEREGVEIFDKIARGGKGPAPLLAISDPWDIPDIPEACGDQFMERDLTLADYQVVDGRK